MEKFFENFINPPQEFSPMPFWFWNDDLSEEKIKEQIIEMHEKGVDGFVIHPRIGIPKEIPYMSERFLQYVKFAVKEAARLGMHVILYDEGMYPSGSAHGMVVKQNPEYAARGIRIEESRLPECNLVAKEKLVSTLIAAKTADGGLDKASIRVYSGEKLCENETFLHLIEGFTGGHIRGIHIGEDDWETPPKAADILNPDSVALFIRLTHEKYYEAVGEYFGNTVIAIFTDEPCVSGREGDERMKPWTKDFSQLLKKNNFRIEDIAALWYNIGDETDLIRKRYDNIVMRRLTESFYKQISDWCAAHAVSLAGHPALSGDIGLLRYFHIPGQDLIFRRVAPEEGKALDTAETTQAKCSADAARHNGRRRNLNECFACGGKNGIEWAFNADDMKWTMDWLFVRGVNMLVPHAFFYSTDGPRRLGERPPDVGINNIWWKHYADISSYIKRMSYIMTDCRNTASIAILCEADFLPYKAAKPMFENQIEFNYLEETLLGCEAKISGGKIDINGYSYTTVIVENAALLSEKTKEFADCGGRVIVFAEKGKNLPEYALCAAGEDELLKLLKSEIRVYPENRDLRISCIVKDGHRMYVIVNEGEKPFCGTLTLPCDDAYILNAWEGIVNEYCGGKLHLDRRESIIICTGENPRGEKKLTFNERFGNVAEEKVVDELYLCGERIDGGSWTDTEKYRDFCGTLEYSFSFTSDGKTPTVIDLGRVGEQAELYIGGEYAGCRLFAPYAFDVTRYVKKGKNNASVKITNSLANKYTTHRLPSGLLDGVRIKLLK